jgi:outer membrane protein assembly factor BamB
MGNLNKQGAFMKTTALWCCITSLGAACVGAQDWPQWRGANRDAKSNFKAPATWPKELSQKWKVTVGDGVATPALVGDRLYVFSRQDGNEITRCLNVADGKEIWQDKYESLGASGPAQSFSGPRSSPAVANGKVITVGVRGMISCLDAATGKKIWRKDDFQAWPSFFPSSSPMIVNGLAIAQLGGRDNGALVAYDLSSGEQKWKWTGSSPAYASPALMTLNGDKLILAQTEAKLIAVHVGNGKQVWESAPAGGGRGAGGRGMGGRDYKAATPIVDGQTVVIAGRGTKALKLEKNGDQISAKEIWNAPDQSVQFSTPVLKNGLIYGLAPNNELFCVNARDGKVAWTAPFPGQATRTGNAPRAAATLPLFQPAIAGLLQAEPDRPRAPGRPGAPGGPAGGRRGGGMGGGAGYGSIVDAGSVLMALTPAGQLLVFEPGDKELKQLASYKVAAGQTHAYPVASGQRIFIKDRESVTLWTVD